MTTRNTSSNGQKREQEREHEKRRKKKTEGARRDFKEMKIPRHRQGWLIVGGRGGATRLVLSSVLSVQLSLQVFSFTGCIVLGINLINAIYFCNTPSIARVFLFSRFP